KGADQSGSGPNGVQERTSLSQYEEAGYVPQNAENAPLGPTLGASETLEYAIDDFAVAEMAQALGDTSDYRAMMRRAQNWQNLFDPATGYVQARLADGSFPTGPVFPAPTPALIAETQGQQGFEEGNAVQYTWSVPQDLSTLFALMGGDSAASSDLDEFFAQLNAGPFLPYDWAGNEPSLWTPWEFDYAGAPWRTQQVVRSIADDLYTLAPAGEPGNDDLGAMASWYVWAALGLYPLTPGTANVVLASPLFPVATIELPAGKVLTVTGGGAPDVYVQSARLSTGSGPSAPLDQPWLPATIFDTGGTVDFTLGPDPDPSWGAAPTSAPPSFAADSAPAVGYTLPTGAVRTDAGAPAAVTVGIQSAGGGATTVSWTASGDGVTVVPSSGRLSLPGVSSNGVSPRTSTTVEVTATSAGTHDVTFDFAAPGQSAPVPSVELEVQAVG
ncbi:MAG TPA: glycoside hydrolase domain-containing protein, partial [Acidimicrobiales bacterium]|nr:glycoside hydrolase domain-containing protein [Acidimicrobiales bacterium]